MCLARSCLNAQEIRFMMEKKEDKIEFEDISSIVYPDRGKTEEEKIAFNESFGHMRCKAKVARAAQESTLVKLMLEAIKSKGCLVDLEKQVVCENCSEEVTGGYDINKNQIVVCQNRVYTQEMTQAVIGHELIHMFDYCRAKADFTNLEHVACSEIRAANLVHCSMLSSIFTSTTTISRIAATHRECVRAKAIGSILSVRKNFPIHEADRIVGKVFDRCYADLEPIGRRPRLNSRHIRWAYRDRFHYDYDSHF